jgi:hypothetical protein
MQPVAKGIVVFKAEGFSGLACSISAHSLKPVGASMGDSLRHHVLFWEFYLKLGFDSRQGLRSFSSSSRLGAGPPNLSNVHRG